MFETREKQLARWKNGYWSRSPGTLALQQSDERSPERSIEDGVDDRIDRGGDVSEPQAHVDHVYRDRALGARGEKYVQ